MTSISKKVMVVGDAGCGKNSLLNVFSMNNGIDEDTPVAFDNDIFDVEVNGKTVSLFLWSTSGEILGRLVIYHYDHNILIM